MDKKHEIVNQIESDYLTYLNNKSITFQLASNGI